MPQHWTRTLRGASCNGWRGTPLAVMQIEAEGLGKMAVAAGYQPVGLPQLIVQHAKVHIPPQPTW